MTSICAAVRPCVAGSFCSHTHFGGGSYRRLEDEELSLRPRSSGRSAGSTCLCVVEAVLSTVAFVYIMRKAVDLSDWDIILPLVVACTACAIWTGASHSLCTLRVQGAVDKIRSTNDEESDRRLGRGRPAEPLDVDDGVHVDVFEYHDITTMSLHFLRAGLVWALVQLFVIALCVVLIPWYLFLGQSTCQSWSWFSCQSYSSSFFPLLSVVAVLWTGYLMHYLRRLGVIEDIRTFGEPCRTKTFYLHAWKYLLAGSLLYATLLYVSPAPTAWRWALIVTHSLRAVKVLVSLRGQSCNAVEEGGGVADDVL